MAQAIQDMDNAYKWSLLFTVPGLTYVEKYFLVLVPS
jgi:hypothetical protein